MPLGLLTGLGAALAWGILDIFSALASRRIGSLKVTTGIQVIGAAFVIVLALVTGTSLPDDIRVIIGCAFVGLAGAGAYLSYFTGLRIGPIAVVSGVVAAYGGLTVILAVVIRGETLTPIQALGATLATVGVVLTGVRFSGGWRGFFYPWHSVRIGVKGRQQEGLCRRCRWSDLWRRSHRMLPLTARGLHLRSVRPSLLDLRFTGDPWIVPQQNGVLRLCVGNTPLADIRAQALDLPSLNQTLERLRLRGRRCHG